MAVFSAPIPASASLPATPAFLLLPRSAAVAEWKVDAAARPAVPPQPVKLAAPESASPEVCDNFPTPSVALSGVSILAPRHRSGWE